MRARTSITINKPPAEVYACGLDLEIKTKTDDCVKVVLTP